MSLAIEFEVPTWDQIYTMLLSLAEKIRKDDFRPDIIVGVSRGGWTPARIMSDLLCNPKLANVSVEFYDEIAETKKEPVITQPVSTAVKGKKVLILDDVADTGKSLCLVKEHMAKEGARTIKVSTIFYKPWSIIVPDYYEKETRCWIVFPWERKETVKKLVERCKKEGIPIEKAKEKLAKSGMDICLTERFINEVVNEE